MSDFIRRAQHADAPTLLKHASKKGYNNLIVGVFAKHVLSLDATCGVFHSSHRVVLSPSAS